MEELQISSADPHFFKVDGEEYEIFDYRHLTDRDEIKFNRLAAIDRRLTLRINALGIKLNDCEDETNAEALEKAIDELQEKTIKNRDEFIRMMTNLPDEKIDGIKSYNKRQIIDAVGELSREYMNMGRDVGGDETAPATFPDEDAPASGPRSVSGSDGDVPGVDTGSAA